MAAAAKDRFEVGFPKGLFVGQENTGPLYKDFVHLDTRGHEIYADYFTGRVKSQSARWRSFAGVSSL